MCALPTLQNKAFKVVQTIEIKSGFLRKPFTKIIWETFNLMSMEILSFKFSYIIQLHLTHISSYDFHFLKSMIFPVSYVAINVSIMV